MKMLLKLITPVALSILPSWGMDEPSSSENKESQAVLVHTTDESSSSNDRLEFYKIEDPFFSQPGIDCSITRVAERKKENDFIVEVSATDQASVTKKKCVIPTWEHSSWIYNDEELFSQEVVKLSVICGDKEITKEHVKTSKPYTFFKYEGRFICYKENKFKLKDNTHYITLCDDINFPELPINIKFEVREVSKYIVPGGRTFYSKVGPVLYYGMKKSHQYPSFETFHADDQPEKNK